jgi:hypothetical protein
MKKALLVAMLVAALGVPAGLSAQGNANANTSLGSVTLSKKVMADGQPLAAGTYTLRLTTDQPKAAVGQTPDSERYVEFMRGGKVVAREVATVVPSADAQSVIKGPRPAAGGSRVELLKGNDYVRITVNRGGNYYLIHLPVSA